MDETDQEAFDKFVEENWGSYSDNNKYEDAIPVMATVIEDKPKRRGRKPRNQILGN